ncbi:MAG: glycosyltransferase family 2 protein [Ignavibacteria bacterium]|nr:glycosyltransferase family 2 protein [Ignavibacteria bacterium]
MKNPEKQSLSVVVPIFNEEESLPELHRRLIETVTAQGMSFEIIYVDDGSSDHSLLLLTSFHTERPTCVRVISFSRNFGHQTAISAGIQYASGDCVVVMDGDLQDPPEVIPQFLEKWREGFQVVYAIRTRRKESVAKRAAYVLFYRLLNRISYLDIPIDSGDFCIMDRTVVDILKLMPERNRFVRGLRTWTGFRQVGITYERAKRFAGAPKYTMTKLFKLAYDGLITFSYYPLKLSTKLGFLLSFLALFFAAVIVFLKITRGFAPQGWASTIVVILFISALQFFILGIFGEYIGRIFEEVKNRPPFVVKTKLGFDKANQDPDRKL